MQPALRLCIHMLNLSICQIAHNIDVMRGEIKGHSNIADGRRERSNRAGMQVKHLTECIIMKLPFQFGNGRVETLYMPNSNFDTTDFGKLKQSQRFINSSRYGLFDEHID